MRNREDRALQAVGKSVLVGRNLIVNHLNVVGVFAVEPLNRIM